VRSQPIDRDRSQPTTEAIVDRGGTAIYVAADVPQWDQVDHLVAQTVERFGVDVMVNNAAVVNHKSILETTEEDWDSLMAVNLRGCSCAANVPSCRCRDKSR
jgi:NAD(P)-dependent dehydrogenase (short-subunit alcohol dehydrogenase family)